ncbi:MAG: hypothetical protein IIV14_00840 [Bacteroidaceae bacterium]|nr:hypothetical protein [Bacteroidaceae bacterium]
MRSRRTRNQRRQEVLETIFTGVIVFALMFGVIALLCGMTCRAWLAEEPITYEAHMESIMNGGAE